MSPRDVPAAVLKAARSDPGSTRAKPIDLEIDGVHFVAYRRACFVLRRDAVRRLRPGSWLIVHSRPPRQDWRVYAFDQAGLREALGEQMATASFRDGGLYAFTTIPKRLNAHLVPRQRQTDPALPTSEAP